LTAWGATTAPASPGGLPPFLDQHPDARLLLVGLPESQGLSACARHDWCLPPKWCHGRPVEVALRRKKDSSMRVAIQQVKDGAAQAAVSAGNTGALMAIARYLLKTLDGIDRPAIATQMPNAKGRRHHGAGPGCQRRLLGEHLLQFAVMGSALVSVLKGKEQPTVGCSTLAKKRSRAAKSSKKPVNCCALRPAGDLNFYGNVEGNDIFKGTWTSWCVTVSSAMWRSRPAKAWPP
jgi:glycerol-3-phosphate acyltransferase PlsX